MAVARHLRYSPVNHLIVDWGDGSSAFPDCCLPQPKPCPDTPEPGPAACRALPVQEAIDTYDWERWLPEVIVGVEDPDEEIAAAYVREAAIEFCRDGRVLQRQIVIELQPGVDTYPVEPYEGERVHGLLAMHLEREQSCDCSGALTGRSAYGIDYQLDTRRNELTLLGGPRKGLLKLLVWAAPTEDACAHDVFLYDNFRADITIGARRKYVLAVHFRDRELVASLPADNRWTYAILTAKKRAMRTPTATRRPVGSGMWQGARGYRRW